MRHELKTWPPYFNDVVDGRKTFEFRIDDRQYSVGDVLCLQEYAPGTDEYTGREIDKRVSYVLRPADFGPATLGIAPGWCVIGLAHSPSGEAEKVAEQICEANLPDAMGDTWGRMRDEIAQALRTAVEGERERCAKIADEISAQLLNDELEDKLALGKEYDGNSYGTGSNMGGFQAAKDIAAAIRSTP